MRVDSISQSDPTPLSPDVFSIIRTLAHKLLNGPCQALFRTADQEENEPAQSRETRWVHKRK